MPDLLFEDYAWEKFWICYQIVSKIDWTDLWNVVDSLNEPELKSIAKEVSSIFDKFNQVDKKYDYFWVIPTLDEPIFNSMYDLLLNKRSIILNRNKITGVIDSQIISLFDTVLEINKDYLLNLSPKLYYDDICSKNVMIHEWRFSWLVDLDFLMSWDYLEAIWRIKASWYWDEKKGAYVNKIIKLQNLTDKQIKVINSYALLTLIEWLSERWIQFNSNTTAEIDYEDVKKREELIFSIAKDIWL